MWLAGRKWFSENVPTAKSRALDLRGWPQSAPGLRHSRNAGKCCGYVHLEVAAHIKSLWVKWIWRMTCFEKKPHNFWNDNNYKKRAGSDLEKHFGAKIQYCWKWSKKFTYCYCWTHMAVWALQSVTWWLSGPAPLLSQVLLLTLSPFSYFSFPMLFMFNSFQSSGLHILLIALSDLLYLPYSLNSKSWDSSRVFTQGLFIKVNRRP